MSCEDVLEQLADYLDEEAREELCRAIEAHLKACRDCRVEVDTIRKTIVLYQSDARAEPVALPVQAMQGLGAALAREYERPEAVGD